MTVWYAGCTLHTRQSFIQSDKYQVSHRYSYFSWWWAHSHPKQVENRNKHTKKLCTKSTLFTRLYKDAVKQNIIYLYIYLHIMDTKSEPTAGNKILKIIFYHRQLVLTWHILALKMGYCYRNMLPIRLWYLVGAVAWVYWPYVHWPYVHIAFKKSDWQSRVWPSKCW